jgi:thiol:disulfide interchange protein DsbA
MDVRRFLLLAVSGLLASFSGSATAEPVAGVDYVLVQPPQLTSDPDRIVVTEFFSYQCPHCYAFAPFLEEWEKRLPADAVLERVPVSIGRPPWAPIAQAFYALEAMGKLESLDARIFEAIHVQRVSLFDEAAITDWLAGEGVDKSEFSAAYNSFSVNSFVARADQSARAHRIPSVPALVVDGKYLVAIADNGQFEAQLANVDALIVKARAER